MQSQNRLFDDIARVTTGALGTLQGAKQELESFIRQHLDKRIGSKELIGREEFEVVKEMAAAARAENDRLAARVAALEGAVSKPKRASKPKAAAMPRSDVKSKTATKSKTPAKRKTAAKRAMETETA